MSVMMRWVWQRLGARLVGEAPSDRALPRLGCSSPGRTCRYGM